MTNFPGAGCTMRYVALGIFRLWHGRRALDTPGDPRAPPSRRSLTGGRDMEAVLIVLGLAIILFPMGKAIHRTGYSGWWVLL
jgi:uncharacterized iron-regulated membrane protein